MNKKLLASVLLTTALISTVTFAVATSYKATKDAWVDEMVPNKNINVNDLSVRSAKPTLNAGYKNRRIYVSFDKPTCPVDTPILLRLYTYGYSGNALYATYGAYKTSDTWGETTITWNNQPCGTKFNITKCTLASTSSISAYQGWATWDVTSAVLSEPGTKVSFAIKDMIESASSSRSRYFWSKDNTYYPSLAPKLECCQKYTCGWRCGIVSDGCGGTMDCGAC